MSELVRIFYDAAEELEGCSDYFIKVYKDEIEKQVIRPTGDFCDVYKELTFILVRYAGLDTYYKDVDPFLPPKKNDPISYLLHRLRATLANRIMNLLRYSLNKSKLVVKKYAKQGIILCTNFVTFVSVLDVPGVDFKENLQFQTSLIEFCEFVSHFKKISMSRRIDSLDLEFLFAVCVHFGFNLSFKPSHWKKCLEKLQNVFDKYSDELQTEDGNVDTCCYLIYSTFDSFSNIQQITLKDVADAILSCYEKRIEWVRKGLKSLKKLENPECFTKELSTNLIIWNRITKNYLKISHFLNWKISRSVIKSDSLTLRNSYLCLINYIHSNPQ